MLVAIAKQSGDIAMGVNHALETRDGHRLTDEEVESIGAGDQGMMFGFACNETPTLMPMPIYLAHKLTRKQSELRKSGAIKWLRPDAKSQVTIEYSNGKPARVDTVLISTQHSPDVSQNEITETVTEEIIMKTLPENLVDKNLKVFVNPTGRFVVGGPMGDAGVTGRKIIVDTYGGMGRHGGGAFSGKDPTKVDRSAAYAGPLCGEEHRRRRAGRPRGSAGGLCHRCGASAFGERGDFRHGKDRRRENRQTD